MILAACILLLLGLFTYVFWPEHRTALDAARFRQAKSRLEFLHERKDVLYDNLRDLAFEYRAGKYPAEDYAQQRETLETEAAAVLSEIDGLEAKAGAGRL